MSDTRAPGPAAYPEGHLLVFAKAPVPGRVKTRLMPRLDGETCARLQRQLVARALQTVAAAGLCPAELWCAPACDHPFFAECARRFAVQLRAQQGTDLGRRMHHALRDALGRAKFAVLIGCDCPSLSRAELTQACAWLADGVPVVLGPAEDGGYVLIGMHRAALLDAESGLPTLFERLDWGSSTVLAQTRARLRAAGWRWRELETLWDLDRPEDLARWAAGASTEELAEFGAYFTDHSRQPPSISG